MRHLIERLRLFIFDERGQVMNGETEEGTAEVAETSDDGNTNVTEQTEPGTEGEQTQAGAETQPEQNEFEKLIPPNELPPELKGHWKRMHGAYTKLISQNREIQQKAQVVDQFYSNPDYARQVLTQWASQNGYQIAPIGQQMNQTAAPQAQQPGMPPPELIEACKQARPPELQWMAESDAKSIWAAQQYMLKPLVAQSQQQQYQQRVGEFDALASELAEQAPGWEEHESVMDELLQFMQSPAMKHPKFGSKLQLLYNAATSNASATAQAANRMAQAARNRTATGINTRGTTPNLKDRIRKASTNDAWELATQAALNSVKGQFDE